MMNRRRFWGFGVVVACVAATIAPRAQAVDPFAGVWRLNAEKSVYEAGRPPKSFTRTYEDRGGGLMLLTVDSVSAAGAASRVQVAYKRDGKPYPQAAARSRVLEMIAVRAVDANTEEVGRVVDGQTREEGNTFTVSRDKLTLTQTLKGVTPDGRAFTNVIVYDKQ